MSDCRGWNTVSLATRVIQHSLRATGSQASTTGSPSISSQSVRTCRSTPRVPRVLRETVGMHRDRRRQTSRPGPRCGPPPVHSLHRANRKTRQKQRRRRKHQEHKKGAKLKSPQTRIELHNTTSDTSASSSLVKSLSRFLLKNSACQSLGWCPPVLGMEPAVPWDGRPRELPALVRPRHSRNAAGTCTSNDVADQPSYNARPAGVPVERAVSWDGARQSEGWSPCDWYPPVPSGTTTRPPRRARSQRGGVKAPTGADPWPPEPPQPCCTLGNDTFKATLQHVVAGS